MIETLLLVIAFSLKHFVVDYLLQRKYQYSNKGEYGHPGGLLHAGLHGVGTFLLLLPLGYVSFWLAFLMGVLDFVIHYHIDWAKTNINAKKGWGPTTHDEFWILLGLDQLLHVLTYVLIIYIVI